MFAPCNLIRIILRCVHPAIWYVLSWDVCTLQFDTYYLELCAPCNLIRIILRCVHPAIWYVLSWDVCILQFDTYYLEMCASCNLIRIILRCVHPAIFCIDSSFIKCNVNERKWSVDKCIEVELGEVWWSVAKCNVVMVLVIRDQTLLKDLWTIWSCCLYVFYVYYYHIPSYSLGSIFYQCIYGFSPV